MHLSAVILVILPMFLVVVFSDENTPEISSVLELFPEFVEMKGRINKLEKAWSLPYKTRLRNYKMKSEYTESTVSSSGLECWIKCAETDGCTSTSFQSEGRKCELSRVSYINYEVLEKAVGWDVFTKHTPIVSLHDHGYSLDLAGAKAYCASLGLSIATVEDLTAAYNYGYQKCNCGWAANGAAYLVMQVADSNCLSSVGVLHCNWRSTWNVYCKPLKSD
ncbi:hypothetical protein CHS0354_022839 [Potamilus streckersoni]|uniref:Link domain-containing protein n=1 Tax=Potamilus streckersoni TaxID=2493646 RepID=A0AAE0S2K8_9BIVA|nr:hypothetical protein CHS0354_022839 [Potamilus streckersoni]